MMQCGDIKVRKLPNGKLESNMPEGATLPIEVKDNEIFLNGKQCAFWSAGKMTIVCGDVEAIAVVIYRPSSNLDVKVDIYPTDYPLPASRRQIKPGDGFAHKAPLRESKYRLFVQAVSPHGPPKPGRCHTGNVP